MSHPWLPILYCNLFKYDLFILSKILLKSIFVNLSLVVLSLSETGPGRHGVATPAPVETHRFPLNVSVAQACCWFCWSSISLLSLTEMFGYVPCTLQVVLPTVGCVWGNVPVLGSPSDIRRRPCESVTNRPLPCESYGSSKLFKISTSDFSSGYFLLGKFIRA